MQSTNSKWNVKTRLHYRHFARALKIQWFWQSFYDWDRRGFTSPTILLDFISPRTDITVHGKSISVVELGTITCIVFCSVLNYQTNGTAFCQKYLFQATNGDCARAIARTRWPDEGEFRSRNSCKARQSRRCRRRCSQLADSDCYFTFAKHCNYRLDGVHVRYAARWPHRNVSDAWAHYRLSSRRRNDWQNVSKHNRANK